MEIQLPDTDGIFALEDLNMYHVGSYLSLGAIFGLDLLAAEPGMAKIDPVLVCDFDIFSGAHVFACRGLLRHESYGAGGLPDCRMDTILSACRIATEPERCVI